MQRMPEKVVMDVCKYTVETQIHESTLHTL